MAVPVTAAQGLTHGAESCGQVAEAIRAVGEAARALLSSRLELDTLCILVREALPRGFKSEVSVAQIRAVLQAAASLQAVHLKAGK